VRTPEGEEHTDEEEEEDDDEDDEENDSTYEYRSEEDDEFYEYGSDDSTGELKRQTIDKDDSDESEEDERDFEDVSKRKDPFAAQKKEKKMKQEQFLSLRVADGEDGGVSDDNRNNEQDLEHVAGPGCLDNRGYNGFEISVEEMTGCTALQCLVRKDMTGRLNRMTKTLSYIATIFYRVSATTCPRVIVTFRRLRRLGMALPRRMPIPVYGM
jgi:hypothetical protein